MVPALRQLSQPNEDATVNQKHRPLDLSARETGVPLLQREEQQAGLQSEHAQSEGGSFPEACGPS